jgi:hypothetical protein
MSLNQRPFGTGEWYCKKQEILAHYLDTHTAESEDFLAFAHLIASDMGMSCSGDGAHDRIFQALATLRSFTRKGAAPKMMRWFSVNALWEEQKGDFWALKLILQHMSSSEDGPQAEDFDPGAVMEGNPKKELAALKGKYGGLALAEKLITPWLRSRARLYVTATRASWTWYTHQVKTVKSTKDGLAYNLQRCCGGWQAELVDLVKVLTDAESLRECDLLPAQAVALSGEGEQAACCETLLDFVVALVGNRAFSGAFHDGPPFCYANVFSSDPAAKIAAMTAMKEDWRMLVTFENTRHANPVSAAVFEDLSEVVPPAVRIMYLTFQEDKWSASSSAGRRVLACMLKGFPDSKIVEDTHQHLRDLQRKGRSLVSSRICRHRACVQSGNLENRGITHRVVDKGTFVARFKEIHPPVNHLFVSRKHQMAPDWLQIMEKRSWASPTPEHSRSSIACWDLATWWFSQQRSGAKAKGGRFIRYLVLLPKSRVRGERLRPPSQLLKPPRLKRHSRPQRS